MTPIEAMAKAFDDYADTLSPRSEFRAFLRTHKHAAARAALLALAECEIPAYIPARAWSMHEPNIPENVWMDVNAIMVAEFRAMLRSIANEHEVSGQLTKPER